MSNIYKKDISGNIFEILSLSNGKLVHIENKHSRMVLNRTYTIQPELMEIVKDYRVKV